MKKTVSIFLLTFIGNIVFSQGRIDGFFKKKGEVDVVLGVGQEKDKKYLRINDKIKLSRKVRTASLFIAAGVTKNLDINLSIPYVNVNGSGNLQDGSFYAKYQLFNKPLNFVNINVSGGFALGYSAPLANYDFSSGDAIGQQASTIDPRAFVHLTLKESFFITLQAAELHRSNPTPNAFNAALKFGGYTAKNYYDIWYEYQKSYGGANYRVPPTPVESFKELGVDFHRIGGTFYRSFSNKVGGVISLSYAVEGRNIGQGIGVNVGVVFKNLLKK